jgi:hypothetical protein
MIKEATLSTVSILAGKVGIIIVVFLFNDASDKADAVEKKEAEKGIER